MSEQKYTAKVSFIQPKHGDDSIPEQDQYIVTGEIKTSEVNYIFHTSFTDKEKAEFNSLMDRVIQRVTKNIKEAI